MWAPFHCDTLSEVFSYSIAYVPLFELLDADHNLRGIFQGLNSSITYFSVHTLLVALVTNTCKLRGQT